jgi:hypothetical protein
LYKTIITNKKYSEGRIKLSLIFFHAQTWEKLDAYLLVQLCRPVPGRLRLYISTVASGGQTTYGACTPYAKPRIAASASEKNVGDVGVWQLDARLLSSLIPILVLIVKP